MKTNRISKVITGSLFTFALLHSPAYAATDSVELIRQALLGAGVGAVSSGASGGKIGRGALIGAGTQILGNVVVDLLGNSARVTPSTPAWPSRTSSGYSSYYAAPSYYPSQPTITYAQPAPVQTHYRTVTTYYQAEPILSQPVYTQPSPVYRSYPTGDSYNRRVIRQGLLGAGVGAIAAETSGGKAGQGALVGAGSNVLGDALLEWLTNPS